MKLLLRCVMCFLFVPMVVGQQIWHVDNDAALDPGPDDTSLSDPLEDGSLMHPFDALQEAFDAAASGDTILLAAGNYFGEGNFAMNPGGKDLYVVHPGNPNNCRFAPPRSERVGRFFTFENQETAAFVVEGISFQDGFAADGCGGAPRIIDADPTFQRCIFAVNETEWDTPGRVGCLAGGAFYMETSDTQFLDCEFLGNATFGAWDAVDPNGTLIPGGKGGAVFARRCNLVFADCRFQTNHTGFGDGRNPHGGAIFARFGSVTIRDCDFQFNYTAMGGFGSNGEETMASQGGDGGAIFVRDASLLVERTRFRDGWTGNGQIAQSVSRRGGDGGSLFLDRSTAVLRQCSFVNNRCGWSSEGGPLTGRGGQGGAICLRLSTVEAENTLFSWNRGGRGGRPGAGGERGPSGEGGAIYVDSFSTASLVNCTVVANRLQPVDAPGEAGAIYVAENGTLNVTNSIVHLNRPTQIGGPGTLAISYSNVAGGADGIGNLDVDPQFRDPDGLDDRPAEADDNDYRPRLGAPGNDAGNDAALSAEALLDLDLADRIADDPLNPGTGVDMGAYEANNNAPAGCDVPADVSNDCNGNGDPDLCELPRFDCNGSGLPDDCDVLQGLSLDCNGNLTPDECEVALEDCNGNGVPDDCDIANGVSTDCNGNGVPDACDLLAQTSTDCDDNGRLDECDLADGTARDCDGSGTLDRCEPPAPDCNGNGLSDDCEIADQMVPDCNRNGVVDSCELTDGDCDGNGIPDDCEADCDLDGVNDRCETSGPLDGYAMRFTPPDGRISVQGAYNAGEQVTVEVWVRPGSSVGEHTIVRKTPNNYWLRLIDGKATFSYRGATTHRFDCEPTLPVGQWTHIAVSYTFGQQEIDVFLNGTPVAGTWTTPPVGAPVLNPQPLYVGNDVAEASPFDGLIDEVRVWNIARTGPEIVSTFESEVAEDTPGLIAYFAFAEGTGNRVRERVNGRNVVTSPNWEQIVACRGCVADVDQSGLVDLADLSILLQEFGAVGEALAADGNGDQRVDLTDLAELLERFGDDCR